MKKVLDVLRKVWAILVEGWHGLIELADSESFVFSYPFAVLALVALFSPNLFTVIAWAIWGVVCIRKIVVMNEKK
jgi:hypothetical protein